MRPYRTDASYEVKIGTESFDVDEDDGAEVTLPFHATGAADAETALASTIMISVTGENRYNDHDYTFMLSRANPVGNTLESGDIDGAVGSEDGLSIQNAWTATTTNADTPTTTITVTLDPIGSSTECGQTLVVKDGDDGVKDRDEDSRACVPEYTLTASANENPHTLELTSQDNKTKIYYLWVNLGS